MKQYDYPTAFSCWGEEEREAIARVVASGQFTMAGEVEAFEHEFAAWHGRKHGVMVNSGSSANLVAVAALFAKRENPLRRRDARAGYRWDGNGHGEKRDPDDTLGDVAVVPAIAWSMTYAPLVQYGLDLSLADVDATWNAYVPTPPLPSLARLVVICSILGNPAYGAEWLAKADAAGAYVLEDNCESFGASQGDRLCGTFGTLSTFSFFHSHQISAIEGGMILTDNEELRNLCRILRAHGWTRDVWHSPTFEKAAPPRFDLEYEFTHFGYNVRPLEMHAAIARAQLPKQAEFAKARLANAGLFRSLMWNLLLDHQRWLPESHPNPFGLAFLCPSNVDRARLAAAFRAEGIDCRLPTGGSFRCHPYGAEWRNQQTPAADDVHRRGMFLGNAPYDISYKIERAVRVMRATLKREIAA